MKDGFPSWAEAQDDASALPPILRPILYFLYYPGRPLLYIMMWWSMYLTKEGRNTKCRVCGARNDTLSGKYDPATQNYDYRCTKHRER